MCQIFNHFKSAHPHTQIRPNDYFFEFKTTFKVKVCNVLNSTLKKGEEIEVALSTREGEKIYQAKIIKKSPHAVYLEIQDNDPNHILGIAYKSKS